LSADKAFQAGLKAFDTAVEQSLRDGSTLIVTPIPFNTTTFSIGMFSTFEDGLLHEYHYTAPDVIKSSQGVHKVDSDSIYRLASITKLLTAYVFLIREGFARFEDPVTRYIPELKMDADNLTSANGILPDWDDIHLGDLICHTAGLAEDCKRSPGLPNSQLLAFSRSTFYSVTNFFVDAKNEAYGLPGVPPLPPDQIPICDNQAVPPSYITCTLERKFIRGFAFLSATKHSDAPIYWQSSLRNTRLFQPTSSQHQPPNTVTPVSAYLALR
jgi:hypothetical protein